MTGSEWTCARCGAIATGLPGMPQLSQPPASWEHLNGIAYCLGCRRQLAGETKAAALSELDSPAEHTRADVEGRIEFELKRMPDRCDTRIARACGTNVVLVRGVRDRLGTYPTRPV